VIKQDDRKKGCSLKIEKDEFQKSWFGLLLFFLLLLVRLLGSFVVLPSFESKASMWNIIYDGLNSPQNMVNDQPGAFGIESVFGILVGFLMKANLLCFDTVLDKTREYISSDLLVMRAMLYLQSILLSFHKPLMFISIKLCMTTTVYLAEVYVATGLHNRMGRIASVWFVFFTIVSYDGFMYGSADGKELTAYITILYAFGYWLRNQTRSAVFFLNILSPVYPSFGFASVAFDLKNLLTDHRYVKNSITVLFNFIMACSLHIFLNYVFLAWTPNQSLNNMNILDKAQIRNNFWMHNSDEVAFHHSTNGSHFVASNLASIMGFGLFFLIITVSLLKQFKSSKMTFGHISRVLNDLGGPLHKALHDEPSAEEEKENSPAQAGSKDGKADEASTTKEKTEVDHILTHLDVTSDVSYIMLLLANLAIAFSFCMLRLRGGIAHTIVVMNLSGAFAMHMLLGGRRKSLIGQSIGLYSNYYENNNFLARCAKSCLRYLLRVCVGLGAVLSLDCIKICLVRHHISNSISAYMAYATQEWLFAGSDSYYDKNEHIYYCITHEGEKYYPGEWFTHDSTPVARVNYSSPEMSDESTIKRSKIVEFDQRHYQCGYIFGITAMPRKMNEEPGGLTALPLLESKSEDINRVFADYKTWFGCGLVPLQVDSILPFSYPPEGMAFYGACLWLTTLGSASYE